MEILKLKTELQNTIKEHSFLIEELIKEHSLMHERQSGNIEKKSFESAKWEKIHSGYLVFLSEALAVSR